LSHVSFLFISFSLLIYFCISSLLSLQIDRYASRALHNVNFIAHVKSDIYDASVEASEFQGRNHGKIKPKTSTPKLSQNFWKHFDSSIFGFVSSVPRTQNDFHDGFPAEKYIRSRDAAQEMRFPRILQRGRGHTHLFVGTQHLFAFDRPPINNMIK
jgi:hypothetical protein